MKTFVSEHYQSELDSLAGSLVTPERYGSVAQVAKLALVGIAELPAIIA